MDSVHCNSVTWLWLNLLQIKLALFTRVDSVKMPLGTCKYQWISCRHNILDCVVQIVVDQDIWKR